MARLFLSYRVADRQIARQFQEALKEDHEIAWDVDALTVGSGWRDKLMQSLADSDGVVALLTPAALESPMVISEVGAARAFATTERRMALLPVLIGLDEIPSFIQDLYILQADDPQPTTSGARLLDESSLERIVGEINRALIAHEATILSTATPRLFVSHRHKDVEVARALTSLLATAFDLASNEIRCTSVPPYRLPFGKNTGERLRSEIEGAEAVLGILAPDTAESSYVMFELGAAWGQNIYTCPLLTRGASYEHIPGPIFDLAPARLWREADCHQLVDDLGTELELERQVGAGGAASEKVRRLVELAGLEPSSHTEG